MKKTIYKFWLVNVLVSIILYLVYRFVFLGAFSSDGGWLEQLLEILVVVLNLALSLLYLTGMILCSLTILLNLRAKIRNNYFLSMFTFIGIPLGFVIFLISNILIDKILLDINPVTTLLSFSMIYLFFTLTEFLIFRKKAVKFELNK